METIIGGEVALEAKSSSHERPGVAPVRTGAAFKLRMMSPFNPRFFTGRILHVSARGLKISLDSYLQSNTVVQLRVPRLYLLAEVQACRPDEAEGFFVDLEIQDVCAY